MYLTVLRKKLSRKLNACVLDRPCNEACGHRFGSNVWWVLLVNIGFTLLNMFHLAYLGVMFGGTIEEESADLELEVQCMCAQIVFQVMATSRQVRTSTFLCWLSSYPLLVLRHICMHVAKHVNSYYVVEVHCFS